MQRADLSWRRRCAAEEGARLDARSDRRRRRLAAQGLLEREPSVSPLSARHFEHDVDIGVELQEGRRQFRRHWSIDDPIDTRGLPVSRSPAGRPRGRRIEAIPIDKASAGTCAGSPPKSAALLRRVSGLSVTRWRARRSSGAGSLNPMCPLVRSRESADRFRPHRRLRGRSGAHSASGSGAEPSRKLCCAPG